MIITSAKPSGSVIRHIFSTMEKFWNLANLTSLPPAPRPGQFTLGKSLSFSTNRWLSYSIMIHSQISEDFEKSRSHQQGPIISASYVRNTCPHRAFRSLTSFPIYDADNHDTFADKRRLRKSRSNQRGLIISAVLSASRYALSAASNKAVWCEIARIVSLELS